MKPCKLTRKSRLVIHNDPFGLRTDEIVGECDGTPPTETIPFQMTSQALTIKGGVRVITTSPIKKVESLGPNIYRFETENSIYELEIFDG